MDPPKWPIKKKKENKWAKWPIKKSVWAVRPKAFSRVSIESMRARVIKRFQYVSFPICPGTNYSPGGISIRKEQKSDREKHNGCKKKILQKTKIPNFEHRNWSISFWAFEKEKCYFILNLCSLQNRSIKWFFCKYRLILWKKWVS